MGIVFPIGDRFTIKGIFFLTDTTIKVHHSKKISYLSHTKRLFLVVDSSMSYGIDIDSIVNSLNYYVIFK
ncbi:hypothetical protein NMY3_00183 [Candidatus Nitrosocosmicus oleophilus]|uniref:Uncharacterized protein n=1 Tax=Candidatus Nitrosocosmicus oleophilus TaxID=1353260 RepID=A0A654LTP2_9ARCH|nr:hypothetical protein NMY3_00183 [Candidatus Nitrosocosmicus oleophilus]